MIKILFLLFPSLIFAELSNHQMKIWEKALLYFSPSRDRSLVDRSSSFFFSEKGYKKSKEELKESLTQLKNSKSPLHCRFPFRSRFLVEKRLINPPKIKCPDLKLWKQDMLSTDVSLVFPTQFASNPASVMGHTFLKFDHPKKPLLLHQSINYSADITGEDNGFSYIFKGLFGGFHGNFEQSPYFKKAIEYGDFEQRDIWIYSLKLNSLEKEKLLELIWELKFNAKIPYYFLRENCSLIPLALIEAVKPELDLLFGFGFYLTPYMSVQKLDKNNLIKGSQFKPSLRRRLTESYDLLNSDEKKFFYQSLKNGKYYPRSTRYEEALIHYFNFQEKRGKSLSDKQKKLLSKTLNERAIKKPTMTQEKAKDPKNPLLAHKPQHAKLSYGNVNNQSQYGLIKFRPGVHNRMDRSFGFIPHSAFSFFETDVRLYLDNNKFEVSKFKLVNFANLQLYKGVNPGLSWKGDIEITRENILCFRCNLYQLNFQLGLATELPLGLIAQIQGGLTPTFSRGVNKAWELFPKIELELIKEWEHFKFILTQDLKKPIKNEEDYFALQTKLDMRLFQIVKHIDLSIRLRYQHLTKERKKELIDHSLGIIYDF